MRRNLIIWGMLLAVFGAFLFWHTPRQPALTPESWRAHLTDAGIAHDELPPAFAAFFDSDDGRPFYMINIQDFRTQAVYPDGQYPEIEDASEAARLYGQGVVPQLLLRGSYPMFMAAPMQTLLKTMPADTARFEDIAIVRYRSRRDFLDMMASEPFQSVLIHKWASLEGTIVLPMAHSFTASPGLVLALILTGIGVLSTRRTRPER